MPNNNDNNAEIDRIGGLDDFGIISSISALRGVSIEANREHTSSIKSLLDKMSYTDYEQLILQITQFYTSVEEDELLSIYTEYHNMYELIPNDRCSLEEFIRILQSNDLEISHIDTTITNGVRLAKPLDKVRALFLYLQEHNNEFLYRENVTLDEFKLIIEELKK